MAGISALLGRLDFTWKVGDLIVVQGLSHLNVSNEVDYLGGSL